MAVVRHKEAIHSGHFMVSNFEAEAQDDEEDIAVPVRITKFIVVNMTSWRHGGGHGGDGDGDEAIFIFYFFKGSWGGNHTGARKRQAGECQKSFQVILHTSSHIIIVYQFLRFFLYPPFWKSLYCQVGLIHCQSITALA